MSTASAAVDLIEACYQPLSVEAWAASVCAKTSNYFQAGLGASSVSYEVSHAGDVSVTGLYYDPARQSGLDPATAGTVFQSLQRVGTTVKRLCSVGRPVIGTAGEMSSIERSYALKLTPPGTVDSLGLVGTLGLEGFMLCAAMPDQVSPGLRRGLHVESVCAHVALGYQLVQLRSAGREPEAAAAFEPNGRCIERALDIGKRDEKHLADAIRGMDKARCRRRRLSYEEVMRLWQATVGGRYTLVESFERGGKRILLVVPIASLSGSAALTMKERAVARLAARGLPNKLIADELRIAPSTVSVHLGAAMKKLGCPNRNTLVRMSILEAHES